MIYDRQPGDGAVTDVREQEQAIAPWWHTALVLLQLMVLTMLGPASARNRLGASHVTLYVAALMSTWMELGVVVAGIYRRRQFFFDTLERRARSWWVELQRGFALYLGTLLMFLFAARLLHLGGVHSGFDRQVVLSMAPKNWVELMCWLVVSVSVGFCEEHVFRGYLLRQLLHWSRRAGASPLYSSALAVAFSSVLFGSLHLYEGIGGAVLITFLGAMYAVVALRCGNLRVVIVAHVLQDFLTFLLLMTRHLNRIR